MFSKIQRKTETYCWHSDLPSFVKLQLDTLVDEYKCEDIAKMVHDEYVRKLNKILDNYEPPNMKDQQGKDQQGKDRQEGYYPQDDSSQDHDDETHVFSSLDEIINVKNITQMLQSSSLKAIKEKMLSKNKKDELSDFVPSEDLFDDLELNDSLLNETLQNPSPKKKDQIKINESSEKITEDQNEDQNEDVSDSDEMDDLIDQHKKDFIEDQFRMLSQSNESKMIQMAKMNENDMFDFIPDHIKRKLWDIPRLLGVCVDVLEGAKRGLPKSTMNMNMQSTKGKLKNVRWGKFMADMEINPTETMMNAVENRAPVFRSKQTKGKGDFILAIDVSASMDSYFDQMGPIRTIDIAIAIASILYSFKKTYVVLWGSSGISLGDDLSQLNYFNNFHSETNIASCYQGLSDLFQKENIDKGTDLIILTDGEPSSSWHSQKHNAWDIKSLIEDNGGIVWMIDFILDKYRVGLHSDWSALKDTYLPCKSLDDLSHLSLIMRNSLKKHK